MPKIKGVVIDAFDTALKNKHNERLPDPYAFILKEADLSRGQIAAEKNLILTGETSLAGYAGKFFSAAQAAPIVTQAKVLFQAQENVYWPREEWPEFIAKLQRRHIDFCIGSNLATPYTGMVREKFPEVRHFVFSCEMELKKPQKEFFLACCSSMGTVPEETIMIGNGMTTDVIGALHAGFRDAFWLPGERDITSTEKQAFTVIKDFNSSVLRKNLRRQAEKKPALALD